MTSDAKIGLLLGLVFIFFIAFVINGLPNFGNPEQSADPTPMTSFDGEPLGIVDNTQEAQEALNWTDLIEREGTGLETFEPPMQDPGPVVAQETPLAVLSDDPDVRSTRRLPSIDAILEGIARIGEGVVNATVEAPMPVVARETVSTPVAAVEMPQGAEPARTVSPAPIAIRPSGKTIAVIAGDSLASVAKRAYGPEEGNRMVNIKRLFEANRGTLKDPNEIYIGQTLIVPLPAQPLTVADGRDAALSAALFEKVEAIGKRNLAKVDVKNAEGRWYLVQDGDNLWKIAASQLGSGARNDEIAKLNVDVLGDKHALDIGMRLRLPSK